MSVEIVADYLDSYAGRDKFLRTLSYAAKLISGLSSSEEKAGKFKKISSELSNCRVILRLLDDIPAVHYALTYDYKKKESDWLLKYSEILQIIVDLIYCPIEHICWAGEKGLIKINVDKWDTATTWFWLIAIYLGLLKSARNFSKIGYREKLFYSSSLKNHEATKDFREKINKQKSNEFLTSIRLTLDMTYAISYLPRGILWGGKFKPWQVGALGTISSLIGLYQALSKKATNVKSS